MKNWMKTALCLILVLSALFCCCACGSGSEPTATEDAVIKEYITGRYELEKIEYADGVVSSGEVLQAAEDVMGDMYVELFSDGTAQLALFGQINDMEFSEDRMWQINFTAISYDFSVSNGKVTLEQDGDTYTFVKK